VRPIIAVFTVVALAACSSSYHPEYHPVTVSNFSQNIAYPVSVHGGTASIERAPVYVAPPAPGPVVVVPEAPPPDFFK
jgi:hypothetical protein